MVRKEKSMEVENDEFSPVPPVGSALSIMNTNVAVTSECLQLQDAYYAVDGLSSLPSYVKSTAHLMATAWSVVDDSLWGTLTVDREEAAQMVFDGCVKAAKEVMDSIRAGA